MATAVELLHTATLIHDDVVDQANVRRGRAALFSTVGNSVAVLVGDYLFAQAAVTASETNNLRIIRLFAEAVQKICAGQIDESSREGEGRYRLDRETYFRTVEAKTAALFMLGCETGGSWERESREPWRLFADMAERWGSHSRSRTISSISWATPRRWGSQLGAICGRGWSHFR